MSCGFVLCILFSCLLLYDKALNILYCCPCSENQGADTWCALAAAGEALLAWQSRVVGCSGEGEGDHRDWLSREKQQGSPWREHVAAARWNASLPVLVCSASSIQSRSKAGDNWASWDSKTLQPEAVRIVPAVAKVCAKWSPRCPVKRTHLKSLLNLSAARVYPLKFLLWNASAKGGVLPPFCSAQSLGEHGNRLVRRQDQGENRCLALSTA